jgi:hypothetical protein
MSKNRVSVLLKTLYKHAFSYMIRSWRVPIIVTSHFYMYQSTFLSKKLSGKKKLTARPSSIVEARAENLKRISLTPKSPFELTFTT